eukprot:GHVU01005884.1.p1 GENE.GHVU01005884.1~~GHVU01005884.1.p1  ORF type:complete len:190 (+),score=5.02 GHVU01005884.1:401-970(+)
MQHRTNRYSVETKIGLIRKTLCHMEQLLDNIDTRCTELLDYGSSFLRIVIKRCAHANEASSMITQCISSDPRNCASSITILLERLILASNNREEGADARLEAFLSGITCSVITDRVLPGNDIPVSKLVFIANNISLNVRLFGRASELTTSCTDLRHDAEDGTGPFGFIRVFAAWYADMTTRAKMTHDEQ